MKIVIDIDEKSREQIFYYISKNGIDVPEYLKNIMLMSIAKGTPLPKGHGRLIDVSDIEWAKHREERNYIDYEVIDWDDIVNAPTIIETESGKE